MAESEHGPAGVFAIGYLGVPGERTFYFQLVDGGSPHAYLLEKGQVAAFAEHAVRLLDAIGFAGAGAELDPPQVVEPDEVAFRIGAMQLGYDEDTGLIALTLSPTEEDEPSVVHRVTPAQLDAAARAGGVSVGEGRPRCPKCSLAMDSDGHICPTSNGDLRHHRA